MGIRRLPGTPMVSRSAVGPARLYLQLLLDGLPITLDELRERAPALINVVSDSSARQYRGIPATRKRPRSQLVILSWVGSRVQLPLILTPIFT